jgi:hypothetical protein
VLPRYRKNYTVQTSDLAGSVDAAKRAELAQDWRYAPPAEDATVKAQFLTATEIVLDTLLAMEADATDEANRLLALYKMRRDIWEVPVPVATVTEAGLGMMDTVALQMPRFGLDDAKNFRLIGMRLDFARVRIVLYLWG